MGPDQLFASAETDLILKNEQSKAKAQVMPKSKKEIKFIDKTPAKDVKGGGKHHHPHEKGPGKGDQGPDPVYPPGTYQP